jgi:hypothetical protein
MSNEENSQHNPETATEKKAREAKRNSIPFAEVQALVDGIPQYDKASFLVVGHKNGVRLALPRTTGVSRAYFYGNGDYSLIPDLTAITTFTEEQRKEQRRGGIMAEVEFDNLDLARQALEALVKVVRSAPAPTPKLAKPKAPRKLKAVAATKADFEGEGNPSANLSEDDSDSETAQAD